jgi:hypothetical protein
MAQRNTEVEAHGQTEASGEVAGKVVQAARAKESGMIYAGFTTVSSTGYEAVVSAEDSHQPARKAEHEGE